MATASVERYQVPAGLELVRGYDARWFVDDLVGNRRFAVDPISLLILITFASGGRSVEKIATAVSDTIAVTTDQVARRIEILQDRGLLRPAAEETWATALRKRWRPRGWETAARYHLATFDYPFLDYSAASGGFAIDRQQMSQFRQIEPDLNRVKEYPDAPTVGLPAPSAALLPGPLAGTRPASVAAPGTVLAALSMTFGKIGEIHYDVQPAAPALRRTSPSGGARHPSEAYVFNVDFDDFAPGVYHVHPLTPQLEWLRDLPPVETLAAHFTATWVRSPFRVRGIVVVTCLFERNMYRYREPRTFRTIHMDAGHLAATLQLSARSLGLRTFTQYRDSEPEVEADLGLHFLEEGYLLSVALG